MGFLKKPHNPKRHVSYDLRVSLGYFEKIFKVSGRRHCWLHFLIYKGKSPQLSAEFVLIFEFVILVSESRVIFALEFVEILMNTHTAV